MPCGYSDEANSARATGPIIAMGILLYGNACLTVAAGEPGRQGAVHTQGLYNCSLPFWFEVERRRVETCGVSARKSSLRQPL